MSVTRVIDDRCPGCGWSLAALGPPLGRDTIPDLGGLCVDCHLDQSEPQLVEGGCEVCGQPVGMGERGPLNTCGQDVCIDTRLHRMGQSHPTAECIECNR